jgi:predicted DCC family thiol-disulfide oxidoreductase YuxK
LAGVGHVIPGFLRNVFYRLVARNRYRVFGKYESCMMPDPKDRDKFLEDSATE